MEENIYTKLNKIQSELKVPKTQVNSFGKYKYRNAEDILEAIKPLLSKYGLVCTLGDEVEAKEGRYYIKATVCLLDPVKQDETLCVTAFAREAESKKGMDESQITGAASSYARKYALNGMFLIDDTKDADSDEPQKLDFKIKESIDGMETIDDLKVFWEKNRGKGAEFDAYVLKRKQELTRAASDDFYRKGGSDE